MILFRVRGLVYSLFVDPFSCMYIRNNKLNNYLFYIVLSWFNLLKEK